MLREENGRLRDTVTELERVAKVGATVDLLTIGHDTTGFSRFKSRLGWQSASEETMMVGLRLECMRMRCEQLVRLRRHGTKRLEEIGG